MMEMTQNILLHEDKRDYRMANWVLFIGCPLVLLVFGILFWIRIDPGSGLLVTAVSFILASLFWFVSPRRYRVYSDSLKVDYAKPFGLKIPFDSIVSIMKSEGSLVSELAGAGTGPYVYIRTRNRPDYYAFPEDVDAFYDEASKALKAWQNR